jgi:hypothetical protein
MISSDDANNPIVKSKVKGKKFSKVLISVICLVFVVLLIAFGYLYYKNSGLFLVGKLGNYDRRLWKYYFFTRKMDREDVINLAKKDCFEPKYSSSSEDVSPNYAPYLNSLKDKLLTNLSLKSDKTKGISFYFDQVPTKKCWLIWAVDAEGRGAVGFENKSGEFRYFGSSYTR